MEIVRSLIWSSCSIMCIIHIFLICQVALRGDLRSRLRFETPLFVELPEIYICFPTLAIVNRTYLDLNYPNISKRMSEDETNYKKTFPSEIRPSYYSLNDKELLRFLSSLKIRDLMAIIKSPHDIVQDFHPAPSVDQYYEKQLDHNNCQKFYIFSGTTFCIGIKCTRQGGATIFYNRSVLSNGETKGELIRIVLSSKLGSYASGFTIHLISNDGILWSKRAAPVHFDIAIRNRPFTMTLDYQVIRNRYYPKTFSQQCMNFQKQGFKSRLDKMKQCLDELSYKAVGAAYYDGPQIVEYNSMEMKTGLYQSLLESRPFLQADEEKVYANSKKKTIADNYRRVFKRFREICYESLPDCQETILKPILKRIKYKDSDLYFILLEAPANKEYLNTFRPIYGWENVFIYVQTALGVWIGASPLTTLEWLKSRRRGNIIFLMCGKKTPSTRLDV